MCAMRLRINSKSLSGRSNWYLVRDQATA